MWKGSMTFEPPMLFALAFLFLFTIGGFSGLMLAIVPADFQYHDTYFVVAHFHYVLVPGAIFGIMAGVYYWLPKWTSNMYDMKLATWHFWLSAIFVNVLFFPQHFLGLAGMPRRIPDYAMQFTDWNMISSLGAFGFGLSQLLFPYIIWKCVTSGERAARRVVGRRARPGVGAALAAAVSHVGNAAVRRGHRARARSTKWMSDDMERPARAERRRAHGTRCSRWSQLSFYVGFIVLSVMRSARMNMTTATNRANRQLLA